ncbi:Smr/MutS family protein [Belliella sp. DSM 111904]|uniref:Endonuclease MutS2 n=1 Tax=Belliella filtrata TaxID=2923435 RepID=A0ABS9V1K6_9BACT|nr:Smr/MutS family protein [Belliella filtrata]MCH7410302.1 Smr/MutS family protein [Belliella filtrata]
MNYPINLEEKINFDKIRELIKAECSSSLGTDFVQKMAFSKDFSLITRLLDQTEEFRKIILSGEAFPSSNFTNIHPFLDKAKIEGTFLYEDEFHEVKLSLITLSGCVSFFKKYGDEYPQLTQLLGLVQLEDHLLKAIERVIDEKGKLRNNASKDLSLIRSQILYEENRLRKVLDSIFRDARSKGFTPDDASITIRGGRMVIPVLAENKRKIKGFIHDESATGQTVYLEPAEVLDINNELKDLAYMERREIQRILTQLTDNLRQYIPELRKAYQFLGLIDFIRAKAKFALKTEAQRPILEKTKVLEWHNAKHPLLQFALAQQGKQVVPLQVMLDHNRRLLIISGPNAGGKSVTLKTVAMLQYMLQCGLLIPLDSHSKCTVFDNFFIDIGDEQNIENDLSTYSSHLMSMKYFTQFANKKTILFIDEFGTGTEPQFGAAIAEGILLTLNKTGAYGVITTHYGNLKEIATKNQGLVNGAMRYDVEMLEPLYQLEIGKPGSSFALEIASKIGISKEIIDYAKENIGEERVRYDRMLTKIENEKVKYEQLVNEYARKERLLSQQLKTYNELKENLENNKKQYIQEAKAEAKALLDEVNRKIEVTIKSIKEQKADKEATKKLRADLETFKVKVKPEKALPKSPEIKVIEGEIAVGDFVRLKDNGAVAEVLAMKNKDVEISIGDLKSNVKLKRLEKISTSEMKKEKKSLARRSGFDANAKMLDYSPNLDIRGKRGEEILPLVQNFVDDGHMLGMKDLRIVHGKGDGILKDITRNILKQMTQVKKVSDEHADRGGAGVTLVELKA